MKNRIDMRKTQLFYIRKAWLAEVENSVFLYVNNVLLYEIR